MGGVNFTDHARCMVPANWWSDPSQCLYEWQSLLGGVLAVLAAGATIYFMRKQMQQAERHKQEELTSARDQMRQVEQQEAERKASAVTEMNKVVASYAKFMCDFIRKKGYDQELCKVCSMHGQGFGVSPFYVSYNLDEIDSFSNLIMNVGVLPIEKVEKVMEFSARCQIFSVSLRPLVEGEQRNFNTLSERIRTSAENVVKLLELGDELAAWK
jgi:hypothetical protein